MRKSTTKSLPTLQVINGWEIKNVIIEDKESQKRVEFEVKYKLCSSRNVIDFEINEIKDEEKFYIAFEKDIELIELKLIALKSCITFLKTGSLVLEQL